MNAVSIIGVVAAFSTLFLAGVCFCAERGVHPLRREMRQFRRIPIFGKLLIAIVVGGWIAFGGSKNDPTNSPPLGMMGPPMTMVGQASGLFCRTSLHRDQPQTTTMLLGCLEEKNGESNMAGKEGLSVNVVRMTQLGYFMRPVRFLQCLRMAITRSRSWDILRSVSLTDEFSLMGNWIRSLQVLA